MPASGIDGPSQYEIVALREIGDWKNPSRSWASKAGQAVSWPLRRAGELAFDAPWVGDVIRKVVVGLLDVANDAAQWSLRPEMVYERFRAAGHAKVTSAVDIRELDLYDVDRTIGYLDAKYKALAGGEGAAAGSMGWMAIAPDIVALVTLNLRAIGEYATYCGFDTSARYERLFAMHILGLASSPTDASKAAAMAQLGKIAQDAARKKAWAELEQYAFVKVIRQTSEELGVSLTKKKLADIMPLLGAVVGGGFNIYFTSKTCTAAHYLYRERFLVDKYGPEILRDLGAE